MGPRVESVKSYCPQVTACIMSSIQMQTPEMQPGSSDTHTFFSHTFRTPPGYPGKNPGFSRQKVWFPCISRDIPNFLAHTCSRGRPLPHQKITGPQSLGLRSFSCTLMMRDVIGLNVLLFLDRHKRDIMETFGESEPKHCLTN